MLRRNITYFRAVNFLLDLLVTLVSLFLGAEIHRSLNGQSLLSPSWILVQYQQAMLVVLIWAVLLQLRGERYSYRVRTIRDFAREITALVAYGSAVLLIAFYLLRIPLLPRSQFVAFVALDFAALLALRIALLKTLHYFRSRGYNRQRLLIVGTRDRVKQVIDAALDQKQWGYQPIGVIHIDPVQTHYRYRDVPLIGLIADFPELIKTHLPDKAIFVVPSRYLDDIRDALAVCNQTGVTACLQLDLSELTTARHKTGEFAGRPAIIYSREPETGMPLLLKSLTDRAVGMVGLVLVFPLLVLIAIAVKMTSRGPVLFTQTRCGLRGRRFRLLKFRTMVDNAEEIKKTLLADNEMDGPVFKIKHDPRVTPLGRALRRLSLDELPQLFNVVKGEMSLVGPRPPLPNEVEEYDLWQRRRLSMKPGLTCLWQVGKRNDSSFEEWMKQDLEYIDHWSLWLDAKVLARTIPTVIRATGR
jgi:exopolysaccharide biosynthesis polyprenyl glycosylphosphotransferase